jgi:quinol monooxygenase YgiN
MHDDAPGCVGRRTAFFGGEGRTVNSGRGTGRIASPTGLVLQRWAGGKTEMIHVIAIVTAKTGMRENILREFRLNMPNVHAEKGCIEYVPVVDAAGIGPIQTKLGPDTFVVVEKWESPETLAAHAAAPHMAAYGAKVRDWIASRVIHVLGAA